MLDAVILFVITFEKVMLLDIAVLIVVDWPIPPAL